MASDPDGDQLSFTFSSPSLDLTKHSRLYQWGNKAVFSWTPLASDVGQHQVDFEVSDGDLTDMASASISVKPSTDNEDAPLFRKPLGEGTTLDLAKSKCISVEVLVEDPDSAKVEIRQDPAIPGSKLQITGSHRALFSWCPSAAQATQSIFMLRLVADDHDNPPVRKDYTILLRSTLPQNCPGAAPVVTHSQPAAQTTTSPISIKATITDDKGLKGSPIVYHTTAKPADPKKLDYGKMSQVSMTLSSSGTNVYTADLPNPTGSLLPGNSETIYYVIVAEDDDDATGPCDHRTQSPKDALYSVVVTRPQEATKCTTNAQCKAGQVCDGSSCVKDTCIAKDTNGDKFYWEQGTCPAKHFCPAKGPNISPSHCVESCTQDADCKLPGTKCKVFDTKQGCGAAGTKIIGQGCKEFTECAGKAMCLPWTGGYCSISDCDSYGSYSGPCPTGAVCVPVPDDRFKTLKKHWLCFQLCKDNSNCRTSEGYSCKTVTDDKGSSQQVCL